MHSIISNIFCCWKNIKKLTSKYSNNTFANVLLKFVVDDKMDSTTTTRRSFGFTSKCLHSANAYLLSKDIKHVTLQAYLAKGKTKPLQLSVENIFHAHWDTIFVSPKIVSIGSHQCIWFKNSCKNSLW